MAGALVTLMWKDFTVRKRRDIHIPAELFNTMVCFLGLFIFWDSLFPQSMFLQLAETNIDNKKTFPLASKDVVITPMILYTPDNEFTGALMDAVGEKLNLPRLNSFSVDKDHKTGFINIGYYGFTNNSELLDFLLHIEINEAIIIFEDYGDKNPRKLDYTIRLKEDYTTHVFETLDKVSPQVFQVAQMYSPFMQIQWAIDSSYIELKSGKPLNMTVSTKKFPYDNWQPEDMASITCFALQLMCSLSLVIPFVCLVMRLMEDRATGVQDLLKMVGVSRNTLCMSHLLNAAPTGLVFSVGSALLLTHSAAPVVRSSTLLIAVMLALYYLTVIAAAFVFSFQLKSSVVAFVPPFIVLLEYVLLWSPVQLLAMNEVPLSREVTILLTGLSPHLPMYWFWNEVSTLEKCGKTLDFSTMWSSHSAQSVSVFQCYVLMMVQCVLMAFLDAYLSKRVGAPRDALPCNFDLQKQYWCEKLKSYKFSDAAEEESIMGNPKHFEPPPRADVAIGIKNVSKVFGEERALDNVSFDVYKGEITVLFGHNGDGKTTLLSIITGMISATEGKVFLNGRDASEARRAARNEIGICRQHNLFFKDLTVIEHVMFFSLLKGESFAEARKSSQQLLSQLGVAYKANNTPCGLSEGMKKRLQLACALAGGSSILLLDELTFGLDVETRRELWDLLLKLRGERTVLLTTHYMEEADALGDRVAALHAGQLRCHATPMHLKKNQGTGYRLSLTTTGVPNEPAITSVVTAEAPDATLREKSLNSISYSLPASSSDRFPQLFTMLEAKRSELGVDSIGVGVSPLEEVFLICSDHKKEIDEDYEDTVDVLKEEHVELVGFAFYIHQMVVLIYFMSKIIYFLIEIAIPIIIILLVEYLDLNENTQPNASVKQSNGFSMDLNLYRNMPDRRVLYSLDNESSFRKVRDHHPEVDFEMTSDVADALLRKGKSDLQDYKKYLAGIEVNDTSSKILYTTRLLHAAPVALNILSNVLATRVGLDDDIITKKQPVTSSYGLETTARVAKPSIYIFLRI